MLVVHPLLASAFSFLLLLNGALGCGENRSTLPVETGEWLPGGETTNTLLLGVNAFIRPAENITTEHSPMFFTGNSFFNQPWVEAPATTDKRDGLGPFFNARACSACHPRDGRGTPPETAEEPFLGLLLRLSVGEEDTYGGPMGDPAYGTQLQPQAIPDIAPEATPQISIETIEGTYDDGTPYELVKPTYIITAPAYGPLAEDLKISPRIATQMIGLGLLEAIRETDILHLADPNDENNDGISGKANYVWDEDQQELALGRFGHKANQPTLRQQVASAFHGDLGITNPVFPDENCFEAQEDCLNATVGGTPDIAEEEFHKVVVYNSLVAVPMRRAWDTEEILIGKTLFHDAKCTSCHTPSHRTGEHDLEELTEQLIWPYTDLLLHDMGEGLADNRPDYLANGQEWRTPPLWGLGLIPVVNHHHRLLHDGRARGFEEAILWHGGEAAESRDAFKAMPKEDRDYLIRFLESL
ncbi:MAG: thiol oxidoreductase [Myxococcales bacterium]|nr:thiol oxidoreductase [Myxococcales bacterium]